MDVHGLLLFNANIFTLTPENKYIPDGAIFIQNGKINEIGTSSDLENKYSEAAQKLNLKGNLILPGKINTHMHLYSSLARGMPVSKVGKKFVEILKNIWWKLDKVLDHEAIFYSALIGCLESLKSGTTTIIDHHASPNAILGSLDEIAKAALHTGVRTCLCYETSDRDGENIADEGIKENIRFIKYCQKNQSPYLKSAFGLHASFTLSEKTLKKVIDEASEYMPAMHFHLAEDRFDTEDSLNKYGKTILKNFEAVGITKFPMLAAHGIYLLDADYEVMKKSNFMLAHNPQSNMNNAVGVTDIKKLLAEGICTGLGTDGFSFDPYEEMRIIPLLQKINQNNPEAISYDDVYKIAFTNSSKTASFFFGEDLGVIKEGAPADLMVMEYSCPTPLNEKNFVGHLLFAISKLKPKHVFIDGNIIIDDYKFKKFDEEKYYDEARKVTAKLWGKL